MYYPPTGSAPLPPAPAAPMSSDTNTAPAAPPMDPETAAQFRNYGYGSVPQRGGHHARGSAGHQHGHQAFRHAGHPGNTLTPPPLPPPSNGLPPPPPQAASGFPGHPQAYPPPPPPAHQHYANQASPSVGGPPAKRARYDQQHHHPTHPGQSMAQPMQMQPNPSQPQQQQHAAQGVYYPQHAYPATQHMTHAYPQPPLPQHPQMQHGQPQIHHPQHHQQQQTFYPGPAAVGSGHAAPMSQAMPMQQQQPQPVHTQGYPAGSAPSMHGQHPYNAAQHTAHHPQHSAMPPPLALPPMKAHRAPAAKPVPQGPPPPPLPPASLAPPPPPPPLPSQGPGGPPSKHTTGTIRLDSKGAATLPPTPVGAAVYTGGTTSASASSVQQVSSQARDDSARRRDTRPIPASTSASINGGHSRGSDEYRRDSVRERDRDRDSRDSSSRGGGRGRGSLRGGRGGSIDSRRNYESRYQSSDNGSANYRTGGERSFSQTGPGPSPSSADRPANKHGRSRADSNATVTSITYSNAPKQGKGKRDRERESSTRPGSVAGDAPSGSKGSKGAAINPNDSTNNPLKKTLTDFRIESLEIRELGWMWTAKPPEKERDSAKAVDEVGSDKDTSRTALGTVANQAEHSASTSLPDADGLQVSLDLQRVDSRKEKRKHEDDEDDMVTQDIEGLEESVIESDRNDRDRGAKKVKAEILDEAKRLSTADQDAAKSSGSTSPPSENQEESPVPELAAEETQSESAAPEETPAFAFSVEGQRPRRQSASASDTSDAEVAAAVIARPSSSPGKLPSVEPESEPISEEAPAKNVDDENFVPRISRTLPVTHSSQSKATSAQGDGHDTVLSKGKNRENSRLRIYFSSPVALESKEGRKHLLSRSTNTNPSPSATGRNKRIKREPQNVQEEDLPRNVREASMESRITQVDEKASEASEHASDQDDDVDGVPIDDSQIAAEETVTAESADSTVKEEPAKEEEDDKTEPAQQKLSPVPVEEALPEPSPDRISISYAKNSRRLVIDANVVEEVCVHRAEAKIEIKIKLEPIAGHKASSLRYCQGVFLETLKHGNKFTEVDRQMLESEWPTDDATAVPPAEPEHKNEMDANPDQLLPPLHHLFSSLSLSQYPDGAKQMFADTAKEEEAQQPEGSEASSSKEALDIKPSSSISESSSPFRYNTITIVARLDRANPLTEAKWVRTGSPDDWIMSVVGTSLQLPKGTLSGPSSSSPNLLPPVSAWKGKIKVADPDAVRLSLLFDDLFPPTFQHALENWLSTRSGFEDLRYSFVATHFQDVRNVLEVLLRLIRGPGSSNNSHAHHHQQHSQQHQQAGSVASQALASDAPYPEQQTPISLAAFQLFKLGIEAAQDAGVPKAEIDRKIGEVVRNLPYSMIYRSLDSMYIDYKRSKTR